MAWRLVVEAYSIPPTSKTINTDLRNYRIGIEPDESEMAKNAFLRTTSVQGFVGFFLHYRMGKTTRLAGD